MLSAMLRIFLVLLLLAGLWQAPAVAAPTPVNSYCFARELDDGRPRSVCVRLPSYTADICAAIDRYAQLWHLPPAYFARLVWQESHFDANALSYAGAEGIAQFMPETGRLQGLRNPYDPAEELYRSARYLDFLTGKFGNLGLAAAAYNGGENRVARFINGTGYLAAQTLDYVETITGTPVTDWLAGDVAPSDFALDAKLPFQQACVQMAEANRVMNFTPPTGIVRPWGIQIGQFFSSANARRNFVRLQQRYASVLVDEELMLVAKRNPNFGRALRFTVEVGRDSRADAQKLCTALIKAGGFCLVVRN